MIGAMRGGINLVTYQYEWAPFVVKTVSHLIIHFRVSTHNERKILFLILDRGNITPVVLSANSRTAKGTAKRPPDELRRRGPPVRPRTQGW